MGAPFLSVVIPAFDEEQRLGPTLEAIRDYLADREFESEVLVVDDCSGDSTGEIARSFPGVRVLTHEVNRGKGAAVRYGMREARGEWVLFSDADLSTPIAELDGFLRQRDGQDILLASRSLPDSNIPVKQPLVRRAIGKLFPLLVRLLALRGIRDTQCGFKLFHRRALEVILPRQTLDRFAFDVEQLFIARRQGLRVLELPVTWINSRRSKVRIFPDAFRMLADLFRIRLNGFRGRYD